MKWTAALACLGFSSLVSGSRISLRGQQQLGLEEELRWGPSSCEIGQAKVCDLLEDRVTKCADYDPLKGNGPALPTEDSNPNLPSNLQGIWWLTKQGKSSSLMSFANTYNGGGTGVYNVGEDGKGRISVRVAGDRSWSFNTDSFIYSLVGWADLTYHFECEYIEGLPLSSVADPESTPEINFCQIHPEGVNWWISFGSWSEFLLDFEMIWDGANDQWIRTSDVFGSEVMDKRYDLKRAFDADGKATTVASEWVNDCETNEDTGKNGNLYYRAYSPDA